MDSLNLFYTKKLRILNFAYGKKVASSEKIINFFAYGKKVDVKNLCNR